MERRSRIPRPTARAPLQAIPAETINAAANRKRRASPGASTAPAPKRATARPSSAPSAKAPEPTSMSKEVEDEWAQVAGETGWTPAECLEHKVTFAKRADAKAKVETLAGHMRRLRAAGWSLLSQAERLQGEASSATAQLEVEARGRAEERTAAEARISATASRLACLEARLAISETAARHAESAARELEAARDRAAAALAAAGAEADQARGEARRAREELASVSSALAAATGQVAEGQRYASELQQYNASIQGELAGARAEAASAREAAAAAAGEAAQLRGEARGLEAQLASLRASLGGREASAAADAAETARLRAELAVAQRERADGAAATAAAAAELAAARAELDRYRAATGPDLEALEGARRRGEEAEERGKARAALAAGLADSLALAREESALASARCDAAEAACRALREEMVGLHAALAEAERGLEEGERTRRQLHNTIQELKGNIRVFCRVRPPSGEEGASSIQIPDGDQGSELQVTHAAASGAAPATHTFSYDRVFGPAARQEAVFQEISQLVQSALDGYNICIFAYGQTGSGKTHTMLGRAGEEGIVPRAMRQLFGDGEALARRGWRFAMAVSVVEIYNEELRDLLGARLPPGKKHTISHDAKTGATSVSFLEAVGVGSAEAAQSLLERATKQRAIGCTAMNEHSSRSHMVFMLSITGNNDETGQTVRGQLNLVDLAGSERLSRSGVEGKGVKETQAINKSLSALGDVIAALVNKDTHVPYRNSRLTHLLQGCLGGASGKALMLVHVAPEPGSAQETLCSLRFAAKVGAVEVGTARRQVAAAPT
ncbi:KIN14A2 [Auxenochlorella protothecoides x Auxenochlorella symbiontica]